jgi:hypothetical protein
MDESLPRRVLVNPIVDSPVERLVKLTVRPATDERSALGAEIGTGYKGRRNSVSHDVVDFF